MSTQLSSSPHRRDPHLLPPPLPPPSPLPPPLQLYIERSTVDAAAPEAFAGFKALVDSGDIVGVRGGIKRTDKGELSVVVQSLEVGGSRAGRVCG